MIYKILNRLKSFLLPICLKNKIKIGDSFIVDFKTKIKILNNSSLVLGNNVTLRSDSNGYHAGMPFGTTLLLDGSYSHISIGNNCRINGAYIHSQKKITIGDNCVIASGVNIIDSNGHELYSNNRTIGRDTPKEITIGNNVWIGLNAIILKGSVIGDNCVIGANSVVKGNFKENSLLSGNPATLVKILDI